MKTLFLGLIVIVTFSRCIETDIKDDESKTDNQDSDYSNNKPVIKNDIPFDVLFQVFNNKLTLDEMPSIKENSIVSSYKSTKKYLVSRNSETLNYLIELVEYNAKGDTILYSYTEQREMNWKDECKYFYNAQGLLTNVTVTNCVFPLNKKFPIEEEPKNFKTQSTSEYKYYYSQNQLDKIEYYNSSSELKHTKKFEYNNDNLIISITEVYPNNSILSETKYTYSDFGLLTRKEDIHSNDTIYKDYSYDDKERLTGVKTDYTSVYIDYYKDSIIAVKKIHDIEYKTFFLLSSGKIIGKDETYEGKEFYHEGYQFDSYGRINAIHISSNYTNENSLEYQMKYN